MPLRLGSHVRMLNVKFFKTKQHDENSRKPPKWEQKIVWSKNRPENCLDNGGTNMEHALNFYCVTCKHINPQQTFFPVWTSEKCKVYWIIADWCELGAQAGAEGVAVRVRRPGTVHVTRRKILHGFVHIHRAPNWLSNRASGTAAKKVKSRDYSANWT